MSETIPDAFKESDDVEVLFTWSELSGRGMSRTLKMLCYGKTSFHDDDKLFVLEKEQVEIDGEWQVREHEDDLWSIVSENITAHLDDVEVYLDD